jgi:hypothetical protein
LGKFSLLYYGITPKRDMFRIGYKLGNCLEYDLGIDMEVPIPGSFSVTFLERDIFPQGIKSLGCC